jgi:hypothetical protein
LLQHTKQQLATTQDKLARQSANIVERGNQLLAQRKDNATTWVTKEGREWVLDYILLVAILASLNVATTSIGPVIHACAEVMKVRLVGGVASIQTHLKHVFFGSMMTNAITLNQLHQTPYAVIGGDASTKNHRVYYATQVVTEKGGSRLFSVEVHPGSVSTDVEYMHKNFSEEVLAYYREMGLSFGLTQEEADVLGNIQAISDHAPDQKKWNQILLDAIDQLPCNKERKRVLQQFFCAMHKLQIASRDVATAFSAHTQGVSFEAQKKSQDRFDDFQDRVYKAIRKTYILFKNESIRSSFAKKYLPFKLKKVTAIRFLTFDENAFHIHIHLSDILAFLANSKNSTSQPKNVEKVHEFLRDPQIQVKLWCLAQKYFKFDIPYLRLLDSHKNNIDFNLDLVKVLPPLKSVITQPSLFFEDATEDFFVNTEGMLTIVPS